MKKLNLLALLFVIFAVPVWAADNVQWSKDLAVVGAVKGQRAWPQVIYNSLMCNGKDTRAVICHGDVLIDGKPGMHPYCAGNEFGCPTPSKCLELYLADANKSESSTNQFSIAPLTGDIVTETHF